MQNTHSYFVNGKLVYVPDDELDDFKTNCSDRSLDYEEGEVFKATNGAKEVQEFTVPKSQIDAFKKSAAENGGSVEPMTMLTMDDGNRLTLRDEDVRQFVQARRQGMPMSRGMLKNAGIPDWYGKSVADRETLADDLGGMFFPEDTVAATDNSLPREENFGDALARGGNVIAETAAPAIAAVKGFGEGLVRSVTDPAALYAETYGEDSSIANTLLGSQDFANTAVRGGMDVAAKALGGRDSAAGRAIREAESALPTDQASVETGSGIGNAVVGFANDFSKNTLSTIMKYSAPGVAAVDIAGSVVDNYYDGYERAIANGANQDKANALASAAAGIGAAEGIWLAQSATGGQTANAVKAGLKRILGMGGKMGVTAGARDVVEQGIEGAENPDLVRTGKEALKDAAEGALFEATSMGVHGLAGANERRMDLEARRTTQERASETEKENARVDARTRYEANLSEEARADVDRNVNEMVKSEVIPSYRQAEEVAKLAESKLTRETGESAEAVQQAVMEAAQEVNERLQTPSRVESPALERRQTEAKMRENERQTRFAEDYAANEAEQTRRETEREGAMVNADLDAQRAAYEKRENDIKAAFERGDGELVKKLMDEQKAEMDAYRAEEEADARAADERELTDFSKGEADAVAAKRARQDDLDAAFADWTEADSPTVDATYETWRQKQGRRDSAKARADYLKDFSNATRSLANGDAAHIDAILENFGGDYKAKIPLKITNTYDNIRKKNPQIVSQEIRREDVERFVKGELGLKGKKADKAIGDIYAKSNARLQEHRQTVAEHDAVASEMRRNAARNAARTRKANPYSEYGVPIKFAKANELDVAKWVTSDEGNAKYRGPQDFYEYCKELVERDAEMTPQERQAEADAYASYEKMRFAEDKNHVIDSDGRQWEIAERGEGFTRVLDVESGEEYIIPHEDLTIKEKYHAKTTELKEGKGTANGAQETGSDPAVVRADFKLENATAEELAAEQKRISDRKEIERRQNAPLKTGVGEVGQSLLDLDGVEGEDLFNRVQRGKDAAEGATEAKSAEPTSAAPIDALISARKILKDKFYQSEKDLTRQLRALPAQAPANLRAAYETAIDESKKRNMRPNDVMSDASVGGKYRGAVQQISDTSMSTKLADPDFTDWAAKRGVTPTDGARRDYDAQQIDALGKHVTKNWLKGVTFRRSENAAEVPTNARQLYSRDGNVVGWYDSAKKEVVTLPGADAGTIGHELGWHATYDHAKERAAAGDRALLDKLDQYANDAKRIIVDPATGRTLEQEITTRYGRNGITDPAVLLDEIGAARYTMQNVAKIKDAAARRQAAKWYGRAWNAVADTYKAILTKMGWNKARLDGINAMTPENVVNLLADEMPKGRNLGKATPATQIDMNKGEGIVQWHDRKLKDHLRPLEELEKEAGKTVSASAHTKLRLMPGRVQAAINEAESFANDIKNQCKNAGIKISELNEFMYARAASERNAKILARNGRLDGSAMSHADIQRVLTAYNNSPKSAALTRIADDVLAFQNRGFEKRVRSGLIDAQTAIDLMAEEPHHVPMKSRFNADGEHIGFDRNSVFGRPEFHEAKGRTNLGDGPLEWILQEYVDAKTRSAANDARQALLTTVLAHPEVGTVRKLRDGEQSGEISRKGMQGNANVLTVKSNGQTYVIELNGTRGEKIAAAVTGRNIVRPPESLQKIARWWSSAATEWSPTFAGRNVIADTIDVFAVNAAEHGIVGGSVKNAKHVYNAVSMIPAIRDYVKTGKTNNAVLREAIDAGVLMGGGVRGQAFDANENALKTLKDDFTKGKSRVRAVGKTLFGWVNTINQTAELMNRMADYKIQRDMGKSKNEAALHAREITVDFNEKGEITPATNLAYMFSNSSLGATMRLNKALFTGKNGVQLAAGTFALGLIEGAAEAMNNGGDEDGKNMNEYTRANSFYFRNGKDVYRIPLHASPISVIKYAGNCAARKMLGNLGTDKAANQIADDMIGIITQFAGIGDVGDNKLSGVFPSIIQPIVQAAMNRDYADRPIEKTSFNETKPKSDNGRDSTPELYKNIAKSINAFGGGNEAKKGKISGINTDYSPEMYKHFTEAIGKNAMRDVMNSYEVANLALNLVTGRKSVAEMYEETDRRNLPVVRDYYRTTGGNDNRYFEAIRAFKESSDEFKERRDKMDSDARKTFVQANPWLRNTDAARRIMNRIDDLRHFEKSEMKNGRSYRKLKIKLPKEKIEKFKEERMRLQAKFIELMGR